MYYIYWCICMRVYVCVDVCVYVGHESILCARSHIMCMCTCLHATRGYVGVYVSMCVCVCTHVCTHVCMCVYYVCMCVCIYIYICVYVRMCACVHVWMRVGVCTMVSRFARARRYCEYQLPIRARLHDQENEKVARSGQRCQKGKHQGKTKLRRAGVANVGSIPVHAFVHRGPDSRKKLARVNHGSVHILTHDHAYTSSYNETIIHTHIYINRTCIIG